MIALDAIVRILLGVVKRVRHLQLNRGLQRLGKVGNNFFWFAVCGKRRAEEGSGRFDVSARRHEHVDDLAVLINSPLDISQTTRDFHIRFINKPAATNCVTARPSSVNQQRSETLHPPIGGDMIDINTAFCKRFFNIAIGKPIPQIPAHSQQDHLRRKPEPNERRTIKRRRH